MAYSRQRGRLRQGGGSGRRPEVTGRRMRLARQEGDPRRRRLVVIFGAVVLLVIAGLVIGGWYQYFYAPPRVKAADINDTRFTQGDLVQRVRMIQAAQGYSGPSPTLNEIFTCFMNPYLSVRAGPCTVGIVQMELLRQGAPEYDVQVTDVEIDAAVRSIFTPRVPAGQEATPEQIEREFRENYLSFINRNRISDADYRQLVEGEIYLVKMREVLAADVPTETDHVEVSWIRLPLSPDPILGDPTKWTNAHGVRERLETEDFEAVAQEYALAFEYADPNGYLGWVPKGTFPGLDKALFGDEEQDPLALDEISRPVLNRSGNYRYLIKLINGPQVRPVEERWTGKLKDVALEDWLIDRFAQGTSEGWIELKYDSEIYAWAAEQLRQTAEQRRGG